MSLLDGAEFNVWLDTELELDRSASPPSFGCASCGVSPSRLPFIGEQCVVCLAVQYGIYLKAEEIAIWLDENSWLLQPGELRRKARAIAHLGADRGRWPAGEEGGPALP